MQSLMWYMNRLKSMSAAEIGWRIRGAARDVLDRPRFALNFVPQPKDSGADSSFSPQLRLSEFKPGALPEAFAQWRAALVDEAEQVAAHKLSFFDLKESFLGNPIQWNRDHSAGIDASVGFAPAVDYRDFSRNGDCKLVWEPSRHHQFVTLARAYRVTGDVRFAHALQMEWGSWLDNCPFGYGMNWRSPLELAIRILNWTWAYDLALESGTFNGDFGARVRHSIYLHLWEITRRYSQASSANNHTIGEAAGVYVAATYFHSLANTARWADEAKHILEREIVAQTFTDGINREQAFSYHCFVLQFFLICGLLARNARQDFSERYWSLIEQMLDFAATISAGGEPPMYGDCDDARVLGLGGGHKDVRSLLAVGAVLFARGEWKTIAGEWTETAQWLLGESYRETWKHLSERAYVLRSKAYANAGLYLLQSGEANTPDRISVIFDCGPLGFKTIAAHGHADALSFTLRIGGEDVLVDPGTYDYFTYPDWRNYFRSTAAHNTIQIDGEDQSVMLGKFLWGKRAECNVKDFTVTDCGATVTGSHNGYERLADPVSARRTIQLEEPSETIRVVDELTARGLHTARAFFHFSPTCNVTMFENNAHVRTPRGAELRLHFDNRLQWSAFKGNENPRAGWFSPAYHRRVPATTLMGVVQWTGDLRFTTAIEVEKTAKQDRTARLEHATKC